MQATACTLVALVVLLAACPGLPVTPATPVGGGLDASSPGKLRPHDSKADPGLSDLFGEAEGSTFNVDQLFDFDSLMRAFNSVMESPAAPGETRSPGRSPSAASPMEARPTAASAAAAGAGKRGSGEGPGAALATAAATVAAKAGRPKPSPPKKAKSSGIKAGAFGVDKGPSFDERFKAHFWNTSDRYMEWLASLPEEAWSWPQANSTKNETEEAGEPSFVQPGETLEMKEKEKAVADLQKFYDAFDAIDKLQHLRMPTDIVNEFEKDFEDSLMEDENVTGGGAENTTNERGEQALAMSGGDVKSVKGAAGGEGDLSPKTGGGGFPGFGKVMSIGKKIGGVAKKLLGGFGGKGGLGKKLMGGLGGAGGLGKKLMGGLGGAGGLGKKLMGGFGGKGGFGGGGGGGGNPIAGAAGAIKKFANNLKLQKLKEGFAAKQLFSLKGLLTMDQNLKPYLDCLKKAPEKQYNPKRFQKLYDKMVKTAKKPYDFEVLFQALWNTTYMNKKAVKQLRRVLKDMTIRQFAKVKGIVEGNLEQFTEANLDDPTWVEPIADQVHALYMALVNAKGFGPLKCAQTEVLKTTFTDLKTILVGIGTHFMKKIKTYWSILLPKAMIWITTDLTNFLTQNDPQVEVIITTLTRRLAKKCFDNYNEKNLKLQNYLKLQFRGKAVQSDYNIALKALKKKFIPVPELKGEKAAQLSQEQTAIAEATMEADAMMENLLTKSAEKWLLEFQPMVQSTIVQPVMGRTVGMIRAVGLAIQYAAQAMFGLMPYVGGAEFNIVGQVLQACENFVAGKLEDLGMLTMASFFKSVQQTLPLLAKLVVKDYAAEQATKVEGPADLKGGGIDAGIKSSDPAEVSDTSKAIIKKVLDGVQSSKMRKDLQPIKRVVAIIVGLVKEAMPSVKKQLVSCDVMAPTMVSTFLPAKP